MIKYVQLIIMVMVLATMTGYSAELLSMDFNALTVGDPPPADDHSPSTNTPDNFSKIIDSVANKAGTGNGLEFFDNSSSATTRLGFDFSAGEPAVQFDFNFAALSTNGLHSDYVSACVLANGSSAGSSTNRYAEMRLYDDGVIKFYSEGKYISDSKTPIDLNTAYKITLYVNDSDSEITAYNGPHNLAANSVDFWINDVFKVSGALNTPSSGTTSGLGRIGFSSTTTDIEIDYAFDNIVVSNLVEGIPVDYLFEETYELGQTVGNPPIGASQFRPSPPAENCFIKIVDDSVNIAGTGNGVQLFDNAPAEDDPDIVNLEYNFVGDAAEQVSAVRVDFAFAALATNGVGDDYIAVGLGEYNAARTFASTAKRYIDLRLYNDGTIDFRTSSGTNAPSSKNNALLPGANTVSIFVNDDDTQPIDYTGLDSSVYTLPTNSVAYWLNGVLVPMDTGVGYTVLDLGDATAGGVVSNTTHNFGKFGFNTGTADTNLNYVIDNILITTNLLLVIDTYAEWLEQFPTLGSSTNFVDDPDTDGMENLLEYALGADPVVADANVFMPKYNEDAIGNWLNYVYNRRDVSGLTYQVLTDSDLIGSLTSVAEEAGASEVVNGFQSVTNRISTATDPAGFMQLKVELSE